MITIRIGEAEREFTSVDAEWINQQIDRRRAAGVDVCIRVIIREGSRDMILATPNCGGGGGGRLPRPEEMAIFNLWDKSGLSTSGFNGTNLIHFLRQLKHQF